MSSCMFSRLREIASLTPPLAITVVASLTPCQQWKDISLWTCARSLTRRWLTPPYYMSIQSLTRWSEVRTVKASSKMNTTWHSWRHIVLFVNSNSNTEATWYITSRPDMRTLHNVRRYGQWNWIPRWEVQNANVYAYLLLNTRCPEHIDALHFFRLPCWNNIASLILLPMTATSPTKASPMRTLTTLIQTWMKTWMMQLWHNYYKIPPDLHILIRHQWFFRSSFHHLQFFMASQPSTNRCILEMLQCMQCTQTSLMLVQLHYYGLRKATMNLCGMILKHLPICAIVVCCVISLLTEMQLTNTWKLTGMPSPVFPQTQKMSSTYAFCRCVTTFGNFPGTLMTHLTEPYCVKCIFYDCFVTFLAMEVDPDTQLIQLWQNILPKEELSRVCHSNGKRPASREQSASERKRGRNPDQPKGEDVDQKQLIQLMARLMLRHEDTLHTLLREHEFVLHLRTGNGSVIPLMMKQSMDWHQSKEKNSSLRQTLAHFLFTTLHQRAQHILNAQKGEEIHKVSMAQMLITEDQHYPFLMWCNQSKKLTMSKDKPLDGETLEDILQSLVEMSSEHQNILRFHALKKIPNGQEPQEGMAYPWLLTISTKMFATLQRLCYHSIWLLVAVDLKQQSLSRSPLAKQIDTKIHRKSWESALTQKVFFAGWTQQPWGSVGLD